MKPEYMKSFLLVVFVILISWVISCSGRKSNSREPISASEQINLNKKPVELIKMVSPTENGEFKLKENIDISLIPGKDGRSVDSVRIYFDGQEVAVLKSAPWKCTTGQELTLRTGRKSVKAIAYSGEKTQTVTKFVIVYSNIVPKIYNYKVINTYPHDRDAFTQGLFFDNGLLYEGTGQETGSSLREVELETGRILRQHNLDPSLFGEGITLYKDKIFQVTWTNKVGFIYNKSDFRLLNRIYYQTEGWGLTTVEDKIVMSDGSNILYIYEPEMFDAVSRIEVYDNEKKVDQLNELEYINGEIWANIWQSDMIARIDPTTGRINSYLNLSSLFPLTRRREVNADVLNGIAWDLRGERIFVTGKKWPQLFEITVME